MITPTTQKSQSSKNRSSPSNQCVSGARFCLLGSRKSNLLLGKSPSRQLLFNQDSAIQTSKEDTKEGLAHAEGLASQCEAMRTEQRQLQAQLDSLGKEHAELRTHLDALNRNKVLLPEQVAEAERLAHEHQTQYQFLLTSYEQFCEEMAELKKMLNRKHYEQSKLQNHCRGMRSVCDQLQQANQIKHEQILQLEKANKKSLAELKELAKATEIIGQRINSKRAQMQYFLDQARKKQNDAQLFTQSLGIEQMKEKILEIRNRNSGLQKQLAFAIRRHRHEEEQLAELLLKQEHLTGGIQKNDGVVKVLGDSVKAVGEQILRLDLVLRKTLDEMEEQGPQRCREVAAFRTARNQIVQRANMVFQ